MRLLLDEDSQGKVFVRLLQEAGHDVETVYGAGIAGETDAVVLKYANRTERTLITRDADDFRDLHEANQAHSGILIEYQDDDTSKNMSYEQIAAAIRKIEDSGWNLRANWFPSMRGDKAKSNKRRECGGTLDSQ